MTELWSVALIALWIVALLNAFFLLALARYVGALSTRLPRTLPLELPDGPAVGSSISGVAIPSLFSRSVEALTGPGTSVLIFLTDGCPACEDVTDEIDAFVRDYPEVKVIAIMSATGAERSKPVRKLAPIVAVVTDPAAEVASAFGVTATPFALCYERGRLRAKGVVNTRDMLEGLVAGLSRRPAGLSSLEVGLGTEGHG